MKLRFTKMQGLGNDYVYIDCFHQSVTQPERLARWISSRHFGVGSDGLILICPSERAHARMVMYNADGSRAEMCGNGLRCVAKYVYDHNIAREETLLIETDGGLKRVYLTVQEGRAVAVKVDMGPPSWEAKAIPFLPEEATFPVTLEVEEQKWELFCVSMGNPHAVLWVDKVADAPVETVGPLLETHPAFPKRVNVEFVEVVGPRELKVRVWERGSGETLACGTGACAAWVASRNMGKVRGDRGWVELLGGPLEIEWREGESVWMSGPAVEVFSGELSEEVSW